MLLVLHVLCVSDPVLIAFSSVTFAPMFTTSKAPLYLQTHSTLYYQLFRLLAGSALTAAIPVEVEDTSTADCPNQLS